MWSLSPKERGRDYKRRDYCWCKEQLWQWKLRGDQACKRVAEGMDRQESRGRERIKPSRAVVGRKREFLNPKGTP